MLVSLQNQPVRRWIKPQLLLVHELAQAFPWHLDWLSVSLRKNQRVDFGSAVDQSPDIGFQYKWFMLKAVILGQIVAHDVARSSSPLPRKAIAVRLGDPAAVVVQKAIFTIPLEPVRQGKPLDDCRL